MVKGFIGLIAGIVMCVIVMVFKSWLKDRMKNQKKNRQVIKYRVEELKKESKMRRLEGSLGAK